MRSDQDKKVDARVGSRVRLSRTLMGMNQAALGQAVGLSFQQIQKYEDGMIRMGASRLYQFSQILDVPVSFFFEEPPMAAGGRPPGPGDDQAADIERDRMLSRETLELVRAYYRISGPENRRRAREFVELISDLAAGAGQ